MIFINCIRQRTTSERVRLYVYGRRHVRNHFITIDFNSVDLEVCMCSDYMAMRMSQCCDDHNVNIIVSSVQKQRWPIKAPRFRLNSIGLPTTTRRRFALFSRRVDHAWSSLWSRSTGLLDGRAGISHTRYSAREFIFGFVDKTLGSSRPGRYSRRHSVFVVRCRRETTVFFRSGFSTSHTDINENITLFGIERVSL